jgi:hypothetical protein
MNNPKNTPANLPANDQFDEEGLDEPQKPPMDPKTKRNVMLMVGGIIVTVLCLSMIGFLAAKKATTPEKPVVKLTTTEDPPIKEDLFAPAKLAKDLAFDKYKKADCESDTVKKLALAKEAVAKYEEAKKLYNEAVEKFPTSGRQRARLFADEECRTVEANLNKCKEIVAKFEKPPDGAANPNGAQPPANPQ